MRSPRVKQKIIIDGTGAILFFFYFASCSLNCGNSTNPSSNADTEASTASVTTEQGAYQFTLEIADTSDERATGLMNRTSLADDAGMLFVWTEDVLTSFWMKDTPLSLDILFMDADGRLVFIAQNTVPESEDLITPTQSFRYVLEVKAGFVARSGVQVGDRFLLSF